MRRFAQLSRYWIGSLASLISSRVAASDNVSWVNWMNWGSIRAGAEGSRPTAALTASVTPIFTIGELCCASTSIVVEK